MKEKWMSEENIEAVSLTYLYGGRDAAKLHVDRLADEHCRTLHIRGGVNRTDRRALLLEAIMRGTPPPKLHALPDKIMLPHPPEVQDAIDKFGLGSQVVAMCMKITGCNWR